MTMTSDPAGPDFHAAAVVDADRLDRAAIERALLRLADTIDEDEGPVILAWAVPQLATRLAAELGVPVPDAEGEC